MHVLFVGERDDGICASSQTARSLAKLGVAVSFDEGAGWRSTEWRRACERADVVHFIADGPGDPRMLRKLWAARRRGAHIARQWVGADVLWALHDDRTRRMALALAELGVTQLAISQRLQLDLQSIGIEADYSAVLTLNLSRDIEPQPLPKLFTVLCYLPSRARKFYGGDVIDSLIVRRPDLRFLIVGHTATDYSEFPHVESLGCVDSMHRTLGRTSVLVRPTLYDGMPRMMLEALAQGRHAITSQSFPHCFQGRNVDEIQQLLRGLQDSIRFNLEGRTYVCDHFESATTAAALRDRLAVGLSDDRAARRRLGRRQAFMLLARRPGLLTRRNDCMPRPANLPADAHALRTLLEERAVGTPHTRRLPLST